LQNENSYYGNPFYLRSFYFDPYGINEDYNTEEYVEQDYFMLMTRVLPRYTKSPNSTYLSLAESVRNGLDGYLVFDIVFTPNTSIPNPIYFTVIIKKKLEFYTDLKSEWGLTGTPSDNASYWKAIKVPLNANDFRTYYGMIRNKLVQEGVVNSNLSRAIDRIQINYRFCYIDIPNVKYNSDYM
jgi:hypothetical protein